MPSFLKDSNTLRRSKCSEASEFAQASLLSLCPSEGGGRGFPWTGSAQNAGFTSSLSWDQIPPPAFTVLSVQGLLTVPCCLGVGGKGGLSQPGTTSTVPKSPAKGNCSWKINTAWLGDSRWFFAVTMLLVPVENVSVNLWGFSPGMIRHQLSHQAFRIM